MTLQSWAKVSANMDRKARARKRSLSVTEKGIEQAIQQAFLRTHDIHLAKMDAGGVGQKGVRLMPPGLFPELPPLPFGLELWVGIPPGFPDLMGRVGDGQFLFIEVKKPGGRFREGQKAFLEGARASGHIAFSARSVEEALEAFRVAIGRAA